MKWDMSCVSQKERAVVEGQVPVGFLVMEGWVQVCLLYTSDAADDPEIV